MSSSVPVFRNIARPIAMGVRGVLSNPGTRANFATNVPSNPLDSAANHGWLVHRPPCSGLGRAAPHTHMSRLKLQTRVQNC